MRPERFRAALEVAHEALSLACREAAEHAPLHDRSQRLAVSQCLTAGIGQVEGEDAAVGRVPSTFDEPAIDEARDQLVHGLCRDRLTSRQLRSGEAILLVEGQKDAGVREGEIEWAQLTLEHLAKREERAPQRDPHGCLFGSWH